MKAVDTNVLARYVTRDDPEQAARAEELLRGGAYVPHTVLLELASLLKSRYRLNRREVSDGLSAILALPSVEVPDRDLLEWAIDRIGHGADVADMMHLIGARTRAAFATFDAGVAVGAGPNSPVRVETLR